MNFKTFGLLGSKIGFFNEKTIFWGLWGRGSGVGVGKCALKFFFGVLNKV
jgi:hypothetical protein